jgi:GMP synthase (glutamine-hydrolysing)
MKIGILRTDTVRPEWRDTYGEYPDMFMRLLGALEPTLEFGVYHVEAGEYPAAVDEVDAYLITGSKAGVYESLPWIPPLVDFVRELHVRRKHTVGICFGHQLIAQALGGAAGKSDKGWGVGLHRHTLCSRPTWADEGEATFRILVSHQDQVLQLPPDAQRIAGSEFCENASVQVGEHILTFQGHPEFVPEYSRELMHFRRDRIGEPTVAQGLASLNEAHDGERVGRWLLNFLGQ